ncbi:MAG: DUF262 domain-containing HNH endonuclease family protein [Kiritimatiellae bacterium]|nr:DUF262 domain-containing HNH endonuclease family protein [Kiritimatiellia bacterium]
MARSQQMVSEARGIGQLLSERRYFAVPAHQRDFAWPLGAVEQFLEDVAGAMSAGDSDYFLGLIVLVNTDEPAARRYEILDGQQRLATTTMTYAGIRQWLREHNQDTEAAKIQTEFIGISEIGEATDEPRLILNTNNRDAFQETVVNPCPEKTLLDRLSTAGRHSSVRKLLDAALKCRQFISQLAEHQGPEPQKQCLILFRLAKYLRDNVQVNCLDVTAPENAYTIFESLNDRGIDLSVLDLLKNHLLKAAHDQDEQILHSWTAMITRLGDRKGDEFLKAFWTSRYGRIQRGRLFREMKAKYETKTKVLSLSRELVEVAEVYANLEVSDGELWSGHTAASREHVQALALLGAKQTHPILMAALAKWSVPQVETLLKHLVTLILRYQLVGRGRTGRLEIQSASVASSIFTGRLQSPKAVWEHLKGLIPTDDEFVEDFARYEETKPALSRWILRELELEQRRLANPGSAPQSGPLTDPEKVNLEHILPKNPGTRWGDLTHVDPDFAEECRHRLGNMCLLDKPSNKAQSSRAFADKIKVYRSSEFLLTQQVANEYTVWDRSAVESLQKKLAQLALGVWTV